MFMDYACKSQKCTRTANRERPNTYCTVHTLTALVVLTHTLATLVRHARLAACRLRVQHEGFALQSNAAVSLEKP